MLLTSKLINPISDSSKNLGFIFFYQIRAPKPCFISKASYYGISFKHTYLDHY